MRRPLTTLALALALAAGTTDALAASVSPANWSSAVTISESGSISTGDVVGLWQAILSTRAELPSRCYQTGLFGSATTSGTETYQTRFSISGGADGIVGSATWGNANGSVSFIGASTTSGYDLYSYTGDGGRTFQLIYGKTSTQWGFRPYGFSAASDRPSYYSTDHPSVTFPAPPGC